MKKISVKWIDSSGPHVDLWRGKEDMHMHVPSIIHTHGYLYKNEKDYITIASSKADNGSACGFMTIPKCSILKRRH